jgi:SAM-dependent methyltransferase
MNPIRYLQTHGPRRFARRAHEQLLVHLLRNLGRLFPRVEGDPYHRNFDDFVARVNRIDRPRVLELGSRTTEHSRASVRDRFAGEYVGVDYHPGPNVDIDGDAHTLSAHLPAAHFDAAFCISVFEHLAMPWKVALELNHVLKTGGLVFVATHPAWPPHERPWDFWRFGAEAFGVLFNAQTGFELLACDEGLPCTIVPHASADSAVALEPANLGVSLIARKVGPPDPSLKWDVTPSTILSTQYPRHS